MHSHPERISSPHQWWIAVHLSLCWVVCFSVVWFTVLQTTQKFIIYSSFICMCTFLSFIMLSTSLSLFVFSDSVKAFIVHIHEIFLLVCEQFTHPDCFILLTISLSLMHTFLKISFSSMSNWHTVTYLPFITLHGHHFQPSPPPKILHKGQCKEKFNHIQYCICIYLYIFLYWGLKAKVHLVSPPCKIKIPRSVVP